MGQGKVSSWTRSTAGEQSVSGTILLIREMGAREAVGSFVLGTVTIL